MKCEWENTYPNSEHTQAKWKIQIAIPFIGPLQLPETWLVCQICLDDALEAARLEVYPSFWITHWEQITQEE